MSCGRTPATTSASSGTPWSASSRSIEHTADTTRSPPSRRRQAPRHKFIAGEPTKPATNSVRRAAEQLQRRPDLLDRPVAHDRDASAERHRLLLIVRDVDHRRAEPAVQQRQLGARLRRAGADRGSRAARRAGTPAARARSRGPARRAAAARPTAAPACDRAAPRSRAPRPPRARARRSSAASTRRIAQAEREVLAHASCAGRARSSGTPSRGRGAAAARRSRRGRR